jgi:thiol-disulfide isomerase/thioredoxin
MNKGAQVGVLGGAAILGAAVGVAVYFYTKPQELPSMPVASAAAPALMAAKLPDLNAQPQALEQWRGKVLVVNFWATWCAPCREEIPELIKFQSEYGPKGVQIVGIAIDAADKVKPYSEKMKMNYPVLIGENEGLDLVQRAGNSLGGLPFTVVLDRKGNAVSSQLGSVNAEKLRSLVKPLL